MLISEGTAFLKLCQAVYAHPQKYQSFSSWASGLLHQTNRQLSARTGCGRHYPLRSEGLSFLFADNVTYTVRRWRVFDLRVAGTAPAAQEVTHDGSNSIFWLKTGLSWGEAQDVVLTNDMPGEVCWGRFFK
jgi:hypothetical protein